MTFTITPAIRRYIGPELAPLALAPGEVKATNSTLEIIRQLTDEQVSMVQASIDNIKAFVAEQRQQKIASKGTFHWMQGKPAKQWRKMLKHKPN